MAADGTVFKLPPTPFKIFTALLCRTPGEITWDEIHDYVWGDDINGGPVTLENNIWSQIGKRRDMGAALNLSWRGSRRGGLYLEWGPLPPKHTGGRDWKKRVLLPPAEKVYVVSR